MSKIAAVEAKYFRLPLAEVLSDAMHGEHTHFELITVAVKDEDGCEGGGYTYTGGRGGRAVLAVLERELKPFLLGKDGDEVEKLSDAMEWHLHYVGRGALPMFLMMVVMVFILVVFPELATYLPEQMRARHSG